MDILGKGFVALAVLATIGGISKSVQAPRTPAQPPQAPVTAAEQAERDQKRIRSNVEELARGAVLSVLRDPESARFTYMYANLDAGVVCGTVNARNGFGGYTGDRYFMMGDPVGGLVMQDGPGYDPDKFGKAWNDRYCMSKTKARMPSGTRRLTPAQHEMIMKNLTPAERRELAKPDDLQE